MHLAAAIAIVFLAAIVRGYSGFGFFASRHYLPVAPLLTRNSHSFRFPARNCRKH
jgi:hypothetical protein